MLYFLNRSVYAITTGDNAYLLLLTPYILWSLSQCLYSRTTWILLGKHR